MCPWSNVDEGRKRSAGRWTNRSSPFSDRVAACVNRSTIVTTAYSVGPEFTFVLALTGQRRKRVVVRNQWSVTNRVPTLYCSLSRSAGFIYTRYTIALMRCVATTAREQCCNLRENCAVVDASAPPGGTPRCRSLKYYYWSGPGLRFECYLLTLVCVLVERLRRIRIGAQERFARRRRELPLQASPMRRRLARDYACCSGFCG